MLYFIIVEMATIIKSELGKKIADKLESAQNEIGAELPMKKDPLSVGASKPSAIALNSFPKIMKKVMLCFF